MIINDIKEILTTNIVSASPEITVAEGISIMTKNKISALILKENDELSGIFTERDVVRLANRKNEFHKTPIKTFMSKPVLTRQVNDDIFQIYGILKEKKIRHVVIVDANKEIEGIISQTDIINNLGMEFYVDFKTISQIMTKNVLTTKKDVLLFDALGKMEKNSASCIVIEEENSPIGILSERDATRLILNIDDLNPKTVGAVMTQPVKTISEEASIYDTAKIMKKNAFRRLVVVNEEGYLTGILTQSDIVKGFEGKYIEYLKEIINEKDHKLNETINCLKEKTVYLDNILRSSKDVAIIATDVNFNVKYFNQVATSFFANNPKKLLGISLIDLYKQNNIDIAFLLKAKEIIENNKDYKFAFELNQDKEIKFFSARMFGIWDKCSKLDGYGLMIQDITQTFRAKEQMDKLSRVIEHSPVSVIICDKNGVIDYVNPGFEKLTGYSASEVEGKKPNILKSGKLSVKFYEKLWGTILSGKTFQGTFIDKKKNGDLYYEEKFITPINTCFGELKHTHFVSIGKDISAQKKAENGREKLINDLQKALSTIKTLRGFLPICASCKKIRDDKGYWNQVEQYICDHSDAEFTHSICPECMEKLYPEYL